MSVRRHRLRVSMSRAGMTVFAVVIAVMLAAGLAAPRPAAAFKAGGHWALAMKAANSLPDGSRIKTAMLAQPNCVAWGSNGPDLAGSLPGMAIERVPWFDVYHYHSVGAYCAELLREALASNDDRQIAFAAAWLTHVLGDMAVHGLLVNPEAGVYIDRNSDPELHGSLEGWADPVVWTDFAGLPPQDYRPYTSSGADVEATKLYKRFVGNQGFGTLTVPGDGCLENLVDRVNRKVILADGAEGFTYLQGEYFGPTTMREAETVFAEVMAAESADIISGNPLAGAVAYVREKAKLYWGLGDGRAGLDVTGNRYGGGAPLTTKRIERLAAAYRQAADMASLLLQDAARGDYSWFSRSWVTDAGLNDGHSMGSLRVTVLTGTGSTSTIYPPFVDGAGTNHYVYFGMQFDDGTRREWKLEQNGYDDFEAGDRDTYYLHCYDGLPVWRATKIWMRLGTDMWGPDLPWWNLKAFNVYVNDRCVYWTGAWDHWTESGSERSATWYGASGIDAMVGHGWPTGPDAALTSAPRRMRWDMPATPIVAGQPTDFGAHVVNADNLAGRFYVYRPDGTAMLDMPSSAGTGTAWGDYRSRFSISVPTSQALSVQFGGPDDGGAATWVSPPLSQRRYVTEEQWTVAGDFNGDRRADAVRLTGSASTGLWLFSSQWGRFKVTKAGALDGWQRSGLKALAGDVDRDGRDELCLLRRQAAGGVELWVLHLAGGAFTRQKVWQEPAPGWDWERIKPFCADTEGDGRDDVWCAYDYDGWDNIDTGLIVVNAGARTPTARRVWQTQNGWYDWNSSSFLAGDFDGDGRDEIGSYYDYGAGKTGFWMWKRTGDGSYAHTRPWYADSGWSFASAKPAVGDFDGDGSDEIMSSRFARSGTFFTNMSSEAWLMDGLASAGGVTTTRVWASTTQSSDPWRLLHLRLRPLAGDIDGDAKAEFFGLTENRGSDATADAWDLTVWNEGIGQGGPAAVWSKPAGSWTAGSVPAASAPYVVDATAPVTKALAAARVRRGRTATLRFRVVDAPPTLGTAKVTVKITTKRGRTVRTLRPGVLAVNASLTARFRCTLPVGTYRFFIHATDGAGLRQTSIGSSTLTVRR